MKFKLFKQLPKVTKDPKIGVLSVHQKEAMFFTGTDFLSIEAVLKSPELMNASSKGLFFKGYEPDGYDRKGVPRFKYQEWWLLFQKD